ncbi:hypothetical protein BJ508DRAFT_333785 [Ascobolus immersus RN42]|uniref:Uncharacterized protein n=1 Tax=Ascobolus immersus RN42 TaxID=1160509 RepID=A0A3N4HIH7_ASCIM|nr:hypothetical protein BJ508DRAFT_333785 [Ascobolus immersus RN42]
MSKSSTTTYQPPSDWKPRTGPVQLSLHRAAHYTSEDYYPVGIFRHHDGRPFLGIDLFQSETVGLCCPVEDCTFTSTVSDIRGLTAMGQHVVEHHVKEKRGLEYEWEGTTSRERVAGGHLDLGVSDGLDVDGSNSGPTIAVDPRVDEAPVITATNSRTVTEFEDWCIRNSSFMAESRATLEARAEDLGIVPKNPQTGSAQTSHADEAPQEKPQADKPQPDKPQAVKPQPLVNKPEAQAEKPTSSARTEKWISILQHSTMKKIVERTTAAQEDPAKCDYKSVNSAIDQIVVYYKNAVDQLREVEGFETAEGEESKKNW